MLGRYLYLRLLILREVQVCTAFSVNTLHSINSDRRLFSGALFGDAFCAWRVGWHHSVLEPAVIGSVLFVKAKEYSRKAQMFLRSVEN